MDEKIEVFRTAAPLLLTQRPERMRPPKIPSTTFDNSSVEVYTDGVCYLFFVLKKEISDTILFAFARSIKDKGGIGFMASSAATQMQKQLLDLFAAKRALRIDH